MRFIIFCTFMIGLFIKNGNAQWRLNGVAVCDTVGKQHIAANGILSDGEGGAFVVWGDNRDNWDIYAQRVDSTGRMLWKRQGIPVCTAPGWQYAPVVAPDGEGGVVTAWLDMRNEPGAGDVYAQRVDKNGNMLWTPNGIPVVNAEHVQAPDDILLATDSTFIIVFWDDRNFPDSSSIGIQKIARDGKLLWREDGVSVANNAGSPKLVSDEKGGVFVIWASEEFKNPAGMIVQHIDTNGNRFWVMPGKLASIGNADWGDSEFSVCLDGYGGAYIAWDFSDTDNCYVQRIDSLGSRLWGDNGIKIGRENNQQTIPRIKLLTKNQLIVMWRDSPNTYYNIYDENGLNHFPVPGKKLNNYVTGLDFSFATSDPNILIANFETTSEQPAKFKLNAHMLDDSFTNVWDSSGIRVLDINISPDVLRGFSVSDGNGGMITAWDDDRNDAQTLTDIYIQRVYSNGTVGGDSVTAIGKSIVSPENFKIKIYPNPFNGRVNIEYLLRKREMITFSVYNILGRLVWTRDVNGFSGPNKITWDGVTNNGKGAASGIYIVSLSGNGRHALRKVLFLK